LLTGLKWSGFCSIIIIGLFAVIEGSFFYLQTWQNKEQLDVLFFELFYFYDNVLMCGIMLSKINNRFMEICRYWKIYITAVRT
jgi:hypothetical protein